MHCRGKNDNTEEVLLQAHREMAGFFGKVKNAGKIEGSGKRGRPDVRWMDAPEASTG